MQFFSNTKIGMRLALGFGILILMLSALGITGIYQMRAANAYAYDLGDHWLPRVKKLAEILNELDGDRRTILRHMIERSADNKKTQETLINQRHEKILPDLFKQYEAMITSPEERSRFGEFKIQLARYYGLADKTLELSRSGESGFDAMSQQDKEASAPAFKDVVKALNKCIDYAGNTGHEVALAAATSYSHSVVISICAILAAVVVGALFAVLVSRSITRPLGVGVALAAAVADGDLRSNIVVTGKDELADLLRALQNMNFRLVDIVGRVRQNSENIATGSAEIALGNADLSQRTETQASNLEETAASMEELSATVKNNAGLAQEANRLATDATSAAEQGGQVVGQVISTMQDISASSRRIADIIGVIDGIAFQTNILALNAAVEAARAGEQGRGFAVVASEVRNLAQRSASAAKEIKDLINASVEKVKSGTELVDQAGHNMDGIMSQVRRVRDLINEIAGASSEQSSGIAQVGDAVTQLDQVTQQNAALVEESAAAAASLQSQAEQLAALVAVFKLSDDAMSAMTTRRPEAQVVVAAPRSAAYKAPIKAAVKSAAPPAAAGKLAAPKPVAQAKAMAEETEDWTSF